MSKLQLAGCPVIGEPTAGWIIYTSNVNLIDGSSLRLPSTMIRGSDGKVMEMNPRPVDVLEWAAARGGLA